MGVCRRNHPKAVNRSLQMRTFKCDVCGNVADAPKYKGKTFPGHVKDMYCYKCKQTTKHTQVG